MQDVIETGEPLAPVGGLRSIGGSRVSWSAVLAGTVTMLAIGVILWVLALAVVSLAMHPTAPSMKGTAMALWLSAMAATLVGAVVGGSVAGRALRSGTPRLGMAHGFIAWGLTMLVSLAFQLGMMRGTVDAAGEAVADAMLAAQATPGVGGMGGMGGEMPGTIPGGSLGEERGMPPGADQLRGDQTRPAKIAIDYLRGASWSWFLTWLAAGILAVVAGGVGGRGRLEGKPVELAREPAPPSRPLTPAPTA
jgi:hypothetical protein